MRIGKTGNGTRKESDQDYISLMQQYLQEKYARQFKIIEFNFPKDGINAGLEENVAVFKDDNGIIVNVRANLSSPYCYWDDYIAAYTAWELEKEILLTALDSVGSAKFYAVLRSEEIDDINTSPKNISNLSLVVNIRQKPSADVLEILYHLYVEVCDRGYTNIHVIVGFTDGSAIFDTVVGNYRFYRKSDWTEYAGTAYASLHVQDTGLSVEEFKSHLVVY